MMHAQTNSASRTLRVSATVADDLAAGRPIVALESTIFSRLGLPAPHNEAALCRCLAAVEAEGARPAVMAVLDGVARVGLDEPDYARVLGATVKLGERDLAWAVATKLAVGATTVSASIALAAAANIAVFATGGIGGVHRGASSTFDVSADLGAIARHPVVTVSAGAKGFLDLAKTLEVLDTLGVAVIGMGTDDFPAFWCRESGLRVPRRVDDDRTVAEIVCADRALGRRAGTLVVVPCPEAAALPRSSIEPEIERALQDADRHGVRGDAVTPFVLARLAEATGGKTLPANLALAENNARVAARIAVAAARG